MFLNHRLRVLLILILASCASPPIPKPLTPVEQIAVDSARAKDLELEFKRKARFLNAPRIERFLNRMATKLVASSKRFPMSTVEVRIHFDSDPVQSRAFSFPGTFISIPIGFIRQVQFENELAALISYELGNVIHRHLVTRVEAIAPSGGAGVKLFGEASVFNFDQNERAKSIETGSELLYLSGYDVRGMASMFQQLPSFFGKPGSELEKNEVDFNVREAQRARTQFLPSLNPIVRSSEFLQFKKELDRIR